MFFSSRSVKLFPLVTLHIHLADPADSCVLFSHFCWQKSKKRPTHHVLKLPLDVILQGWACHKTLLIIHMKKEVCFHMLVNEKPR